MFNFEIYEWKSKVDFLMEHYLPAALGIQCVIALNQACNKRSIFIMFSMLTIHENEIKRQ